MFAVLFEKICDVFGKNSKNLIRCSVIAFETPFTGWLMLFPNYYLLETFGQSSKNLVRCSVIAFETHFTGWLMLFPSYYLLETSLLHLLVFIGDSISYSSGCSVSWLMFDTLTAPVQCLHSELKRQKNLHGYVLGLIMKIPAASIFSMANMRIYVLVVRKVIHFPLRKRLKGFFPVLLASGG